MKCDSQVSLVIHLIEMQIGFQSMAETRTNLITIMNSCWPGSWQFKNQMKN